MNRTRIPRTFLAGIACNVLFWTQAYAQELLLDVQLKAGDKTIDMTQATAPTNEETHIEIGNRYKLTVVPTLVGTDMVSFQANIIDSTMNAPMAISTRTQIGHAAKLLNHFKGDQEIEITARLK